MALPDLTGLNIEDTYQRILQTDGVNIYDGTGSLVNIAATGPFATTGSNTFIGNQTIQGNVAIAGTASIAYLNVAIESASIIYSSGSNQFGDAANDTQTLFGNVIIPTGSLTVNGNISASGDLFINNGANQIRIGDNIDDNTSSDTFKIYNSGTKGFVSTYFYSSTLELKAGASGSSFVNNWSKIEIADNFSSNGYIRLFTSGSERMRISNTGYVGIGTANPTLPLQITSGSNTLSFDPTFARISSGDTNVQLFAGSQNIFRGLDNWAGTWSDGATTTYFQTGRQAGNTAFSTYLGTQYNRVAFLTSRFQITNLNGGNTPPTNYFQIDSNNVNLFSVANSANIARVGINNISPSASLHISGASAEVLLRVDSPTSSSILHVSGSGQIAIGSNNSFSYKLYVQGGTSYFNSILAIDPTQYLVSRYIYSGTGRNILPNGIETTALVVGTNTASSLAQLHARGTGTTSATAAMRVENANASASLVVLDDGNIGIRTSSPTSFLDIRGTQTSPGTSTRIANISTIISASANNDTLIGLDIQPTYHTGAFTGVSTYAIRAHGSIYSSGFLFGAGVVGNTSLVLSSAGSNNVSIATNSTGGEKLRVFGSTGNVLIQTGGTFTDAGYRLDVSGSGRFTNGLDVTGSLDVQGTITNNGVNIQALSIAYAIVL